MPALSSDCRILSVHLCELVLRHEDGPNRNKSAKIFEPYGQQSAGKNSGTQA